MGKRKHFSKKVYKDRDHLGWERFHASFEGSHRHDPNSLEDFCEEGDDGSDESSENNPVFWSFELHGDDELDSDATINISDGLASSDPYTPPNEADSIEEEETSESFPDEVITTGNTGPQYVFSNNPLDERPCTDREAIADHAMVEFIQCCNQGGTTIKFYDEFMSILKRHL